MRKRKIKLKSDMSEYTKIIEPKKNQFFEISNGD